MTAVFFLTNLRLGSEAYFRIVNPDMGVAPTSDRIVDDCARVWASIRAIIENEGAFVLHLDDCTGHRKVPGNTARNQWGGRREKRVAEHFLLGGEVR